MEVINDQGEKHWGSYDAVDHGFDSRARSPFGQEQNDVLMPPGPPGPIGPDWSQLLGAAWVQQGAIRVLKPEMVQPVLAALAFMSPPPPGVPPGYWTAMPTPVPNAWAQSYLSAGNTIMIDVASPLAADGSRQLRLASADGSAAVNDVRSSTSGALPHGAFAVVAGPPAVLAAAAAAQPPPGGYVDQPATAGMSTGVKVGLFVAGVVVLSAAAGWLAPKAR